VHTRGQPLFEFSKIVDFWSCLIDSVPISRKTGRKRGSAPQGKGARCHEYESGGILGGGPFRGWWWQEGSASGRIWGSPSGGYGVVAEGLCVFACMSVCARCLMNPSPVPQTRVSDMSGGAGDVRVLIAHQEGWTAWPETPSTKSPVKRARRCRPQP
jgi:hypothetical protein